MRVSEIFYSIQGEGITAGQPSVFLRLHGCNLNCRWCDTNENFRTWQDLSSSDIVTILDQKGWRENLIKNTAGLVITGGEPLLQQDSISELLKFSTFGGMPRVEIETNGTIGVTDELWPMVSQFNVSPKLSNSGATIEPNHDIFKRLVVSTKQSFFKFVIETNDDLMEAIDKYIVPYSIPPRRIILMPEGATREKLIKTAPAVVEMCKKHGFTFSSRHQVVIWDKSTGV